MGILTTRFSGVKNTFVVRIILLSSLFSIGWFTYSAYINNVYHHAQTAIRDGDLGQGFSLLNSIYDPQLNTAHSYKDLIPFKMAQLANEIGEVDKAIIYYEESIMKAPYNGELLYEYGKFLLDHDVDLIKAEELLIRAESQQANRHAVNYCLAELYIQKKEWNRARSYINKLENSSYEHKGGKLLEVVQLNELKE
jgi:tetratricopeptide (TPR) repeat protein